MTPEKAKSTDVFQFRNLKQLIDDFAAPYATSNGSQHERAKAELAAKLSTDICTAFNRLESSMVESAESNSLLGKRVFWLNVILTFATCVGAIATVFMALG